MSVCVCVCWPQEWLVIGEGEVEEAETEREDGERKGMATGGCTGPAIGQDKLTEGEEVRGLVLNVYT